MVLLAQLSTALCLTLRLRVKILSKQDAVPALKGWAGGQAVCGLLTGHEGTEGPLALARVVRLPGRGGAWAEMDRPAEEVGNTVRLIQVAGAGARGRLVRDRLERDLLPRVLTTRFIRLDPNTRITERHNSLRRRMTQSDFCFASFW